MIRFSSFEEAEHLQDLVNRSVHWFGFTDLVTKEESYHRTLTDILLAIDYDYSYPLIVFVLNKRMPDLEEIVHTDTELNSKGVTFYLNEPLSVYEDTDGITRAVELDSILIYAEKNNLSNITVYTCDYNCDTVMTYYTSHMKLITDDVFIKTIRSTRTTLSTNTFTKKFVNLNRRFTDHRHIIASYMSQLSCYCTWTYKVDDTVTEIYKWADLDYINKHVEQDLFLGMKVLNDNSPLVIDLPPTVVKVSGIQSIHDVNGSAIKIPDDIEHVYSDIFCDVVTETKYTTPLANISEKTLKPIGYMKPFILVAPPYSLEYLRTLGYKTFSDYWDESYDTETDHQLRMIKILQLIDHLNNMTLDELRNLYDNMQEVLTHNYNVLVEALPNYSYKQKLKLANKTLRETIWMMEYKIQ